MINIKELEKKINKVLDDRYFEYDYAACLEQNKRQLKLTVYIRDVCDLFSCKCEISEATNEEEALKFLIDNLYRQHDKDKKTIKSYKGKLDRKLKQLSNAKNEHDDDKIIKITKITDELINLYKEKNSAKYNWDVCKDSTHILYEVLDEIIRESR